MDDLSDARSLRPLKANTYPTNLAGSVSVRVAPDGTLKVGIVTYDWGHLGGRSGFLYSDERRVPERDDDGFLWFDVPGTLGYPNPGTEIAPHWWKVHSMYD